MLMNWRLSVEIFAVFVSYLIITLPLVGATEVNVFYGGTVTSGGDIDLDYSDIVAKSVAVNNPGDSASVSVTVSNATTDKGVLETYVYKCGASTPTVCISQTTPTKYEGNFEASYGWSDIRDGTSYPQTANIMTVVKVKRSGGVSWLGYWDVITRSSGSDFSADSAEIDEIEVHANSLGHVGSIIYFIENFFMLPMNTNWVSRVVFKTAAEINELKVTEMPIIDADVVSGDEITSISELYHFIFPSGSGILGSSTLYLNPEYTCGNDICESDPGVGETKMNCCYDCGCSTGYYCDLEVACKSENSISMSLHGSPETRVVNCNEDHVIKIPVVVNNAPSDAIVKSAEYSLGGDVKTTTCKKGGGLFSCEINVPAVADCNTGEYWVGPNSLTVMIEFSNGPSTKTKSMTVSFPDITIGSFDCDNDVCESTLGENQGTCCIDCGCPDGDYCDWGGFGSAPRDAECKDPLTNSDLYMGSINPSHFNDQPLGGNSPDIAVNIGNSPSNLQIESLTCEMQCSSNEGACQSSCSLQGCVTDESVPDIYKKDCTLNFVISGYDPLTDYEISPVFTADVRYSNGTDGVIDTTLTNTFPIISIGAHWCGDFICGSDESSYLCCYDCGCPEGQYCDTKSLNGPSSGDGCKSKGFALEVDDIGDTFFQDSTVQHYLDITGHVSNFPSGTMIYGECVLQLGDFDCSLICTRADSSVDTEYNFTCQMIIPPIDYISSPYYNAATRMITLTENSYTIKHLYYEGPDNKTIEHDFEPGDIKLNVTSHCSEGGCEVNLGETQTSCCRDCGCSNYGNDYFCYTGQNPSGQCLPNSSILLEITSFEPDPINCIIYKEGEECIITLNTMVNSKIINPPADIIILESYYSASSQDNDTSISCYDTLEDNSYVCPIAFENIPGATEVGEENISIDLKMTIEYMIGDAIVWQSIQTASSQLTINKELSSALSSCQEMMDAMDQQIADLEASQGQSNIWAIILIVLAVVFIVLYIACSAETWGFGAASICYPYLMLALTCITTAITMWNSASDMDSQISALEAQKAEKQAMCDAQSTAELAAAQASGLTPIPSIGS